MAKYSSVPVKQDTYKRLKRIQLELVKKKGRLNVTLDEVVNTLIDEWRGSSKKSVRRPRRKSGPR